jgi:dihydroflavonol-4-reductase
VIYAVTGATGHVGYNLIKKLAEKNKKIRAFVLPNDNTTILDNFNIEIIYGDITDKSSIYPLFETDNEKITLIHLAGIININNKVDDRLVEVNVNGTKNVIDIAIEKKVDHIVYSSSVHAIKEEKNKGLITETETFDSSLVVGAYAKTKAEATKYVIKKLNEGYPITIVHPSGIIGPYDYNKGHMTKLIEKYLNRTLGSRVTGGYDFVDVRDVVSAIYQLAENKITGTYILSGHYVSLKDFFQNLRTLSGRKRRIAVFANKFVRMLTPIIECYYKIKGKPPLFTKYSLYTLQSNSNFSNEKIKSVIEYNPRSISETLYDTAVWLIDEKHLTHRKTIDYLKGL